MKTNTNQSASIRKTSITLLTTNELPSVCGGRSIKQFFKDTSELVWQNQ